MLYRTLGRTWLRISAISFGAGPVSGWMAELPAQQQRAVIKRALEVGINWFDTAAGYGDGQSEDSLGEALGILGIPSEVHLATKVRYLPEHLNDIRGRTRGSFASSLERLRVKQVTLLQLHNSITAERGDEPTSITPKDVLGPGGVLEAFEELRSEGLVRFLGLTGIGQPAALREVVRSRAFDTMQVPYNLLNPSAGHPMPKTFPEANYGNIIEECAWQGMGVLAIRVFAAGALLGAPPSAHTLKTPFFPLALYQRDEQRAARLKALLGPACDLKSEAIQFVLGHPHVSSTLIGFREPQQVYEAVDFLSDRPYPAACLRTVLSAAGELMPLPEGHT